MPFSCDLRGAAEPQKCLDSKILPIQDRRSDLNMAEVTEEPKTLVSLKLLLLFVVVVVLQLCDPVVSPHCC